jgi:hypothetical protein
MAGLECLDTEKLAGCAWKERRALREATRRAARRRRAGGRAGGRTLLSKSLLRKREEKR